MSTTMDLELASERAIHDSYLEGELRRLRVLLRAHVRRLRREWSAEGNAEDRRLWISDSEVDRLLRRNGAGPIPAPEAAEEAELRRIEADLDEMARVGRPREPALVRLARLFDLTPLERDVLLLCLAPELDPSFRRLYAYVQDDLAACFPGAQLALDLFAPAEEGRPAARESLRSHAPLRRFLLIEAARNGEASIGWRAPERIVDFVQGSFHPDEQLARLLQPIPAGPLSVRQAELAERLAAWASSRLAQGSWPHLNLVGPAGSGLRALSRTVCDRLGLTVVAVDPARLAEAPVPALLEREAVLGQFALYLDAIALDSGAAGAQGVAAAFGTLHAFVIVGSRRVWPSDRDVLSVTVPKPDAAEQVSLWRQALAGTATSGSLELEPIAEQFDFGPTLISRSLRHAHGQARLRDPQMPVITRDDLWLACRQSAAHGMDALAQTIAPCHSWDDLVVPPRVRSQLEEIAGQVAQRHLVYGGWGFGRKLNRGRGVSALFSGPSGTGKTLAAEVLSARLDLDLYRIDLSSVVSKYIGETEKNLGRVFDAAERGGAILFFDEADALFGKRTEVKESHDRYANIEIDYLLQRMEEYRGLAILATNMRSHIDPAFLRRLRFVVEFPFPDFEHRKRIWQGVFPPGAPLGDVRHDLLARLEIPGGNIRNIALNAAFLAAGEGRDIGMDHLMRAAAREYAKEERLVTSAEFGPYFDAAQR